MHHPISLLMILVGPRGDQVKGEVFWSSVNVHRLQRALVPNIVVGMSTDPTSLSKNFQLLTNNDTNKENSSLNIREKVVFKKKNRAIVIRPQR